jgi:hypothetical protein
MTPFFFWTAAARRRFPMCGTLYVEFQNPPEAARNPTESPRRMIYGVTAPVPTPMKKRRRDRRTKSVGHASARQLSVQTPAGGFT